MAVADGPVEGEDLMRLATVRAVGVVASLVLAASLVEAPQARSASTYHRFLGDYPRSRENGWSHEAQGVAHDAGFWYFTQRDRLLKFPIDFDLNAGIDRNRPPSGVLSRPIPTQLARAGYDHLGDLDYDRGYLYVPAEDVGSYDNQALGIGHQPPAIAVFRASDLSLVDYHAPGRRSDMPWVALHPTTHLLYTSNFYIGSSAFDRASLVQVYRPVFTTVSEFGSSRLVVTFELVDQVPLYDGRGARMPLSRVQGGTFTPTGELYLVSGDAYASASEGGVLLFDRSRIFLTRSNNGQDPFNFAFSPGCCTYEEPEGITWWDRSDGRSPGIRGQLHVIMLDNDYSTDDLYLKHYQLGSP